MTVGLKVQTRSAWSVGIQLKASAGGGSLCAAVRPWTPETGIISSSAGGDSEVRSLDALVGLYLRSSDFLKLRPRTQRDYLAAFKPIRTRFGAMSLAEIDGRGFTNAIFTWREENRGAPRVADYRLQVLKLLLSWARRRGLIDHNRAQKMGRLYRSKRRQISWSDAQIAAFNQVAPAYMQFALTIALETGQRQADLLALDWSMVDSDFVQVVQQKTGTEVAVPISSCLRAALDALPGDRTGKVLRRADGTEWRDGPNGFRSAWRKTCLKAGVRGVTFHDLRGGFVTRRLAEGWTALEVAMCTGHSIRDLAMLDTYADRRVVAQRTAERLAARLKNGAVGEMP